MYIICLLFCLLFIVSFTKTELAKIKKKEQRITSDKNMSKINEKKYHKEMSRKTEFKIRQIRMQTNPIDQYFCKHLYQKQQPKKQA